MPNKGFGRQMVLQEQEANKLVEDQIASRNEMTMRLKEKFEKTPGLELDNGVLDEMFQADPHKAENLVVTLEQTEQGAFSNRTLLENLRAYKSLKEASRLNEDGLNSDFLGMTPMDIVKVTRIGYQNAVTQDIFDVWSMKSMKDTFFKLQTTYGSTARGATKDAVIYENYNDGRYATPFEHTDITGDGSKDYTATLAEHPVVPFKVAVYLDGQQVAGDNGSGILVGSALDATKANTVNYTTGDVVLNFSAAVEASSELYIEYAYNFEDSSLFGQTGSVLLNLIAYDFRAILLPFAIEWGRFTEELMQSKMGMSAKEQMVLGAGDLFRKSFDEFTIAKGIGAAKWAAPVQFDTNFSTAGAHDSIAHAQSVLNAIVSAEMLTYAELGRLPDKTNLVVDAPARNYLSKHKLFTSFNSPSKIGIFKVGSIDGRDIYMAPPNVIKSEAGHGKIYVFGKSADAMNVDSVVSVGMWKASVTTDPVELKNFNSQMGIGIMADVRKNNPKFATAVDLTNLTANS